MQSWVSQLRDELDRLDAAHQLRTLQPVEQGGTKTEEARGRLIRFNERTLLNLGGNDYLGLSFHPHICKAAIDTIVSSGCGAGASRLVIGHQHIHDRVEQRFAAFKHAEAALLFATGYIANFAVITSLAHRNDLICIDKLSHASLIDAARATATQGTQVRIYPHLQLSKIEKLLYRHKHMNPNARRFIVTDSVFSMDGDTADLPALCDLAEQYDAVLIVDEAHATGLFGPTGSGLCEEQGVVGRVPVIISTASKALGGLGGIVTGPRVLVDTLINKARPFIFTTAVPPAQAAAIEGALDVIRTEPHRRQRLRELAKRVRSELRRRGWLDPTLPDQRIATPIVPLIVGKAHLALELSEYLLECGLFVPAIRPPAVARNTARLRVSLRADLEDVDVDQLLEALDRWPGRLTGKATTSYHDTVASG